jgi:hypothetical protein
VTVRGADALIEEVRVLRLQPGDEIVLRLSRSLSKGAMAGLIEQAEQRWPGHRVTVLHEDVVLEVVRAEEPCACGAVGDHGYGAFCG